MNEVEVGLLRRFCSDFFRRLSLVSFICVGVNGNGFHRLRLAYQEVRRFALLDLYNCSEGGTNGRTYGVRDVFRNRSVFVPSNGGNIASLPGYGGSLAVMRLVRIDSNSMGGEVISVPTDFQLVSTVISSCSGSYAMQVPQAVGYTSLTQTGSVIERSWTSAFAQKSSTGDFSVVSAHFSMKGRIFLFSLVPVPVAASSVGIGTLFAARW